MAIALNYDGLRIKGNVTAEGLEDQITIDSFQFGVARHITMEPGNFSNRESTRPALSEITMTKILDNGCTALFKDGVAGTTGTPAVFSFYRTGPEGVDTYLKYELEDVIISSYSISAHGDSEAMETISFSYSKLTAIYTDNDKKNVGGNQQVASYDLATAKPG